jgi:hypothetical protein
MCALYIGNILVGKKAGLPDPCYHENEVCFWNHGAPGPRVLGLSVILVSPSLILFKSFHKFVEFKLLL